jgi:paraquat-inducible protein A
MIHSPQDSQHSSALSTVRLCQGCDLAVEVIDIPRGKEAHCPRCGTELYRGGSPSLAGNLALALTCLVLFIPSYWFDYLHITLVGMNITASVPAGVLALYHEGYWPLSILVLFCACIAPLLVCGSVITTHLSLYYRHFKTLKISLAVMQHLRGWAMVDVFLISIAVACVRLWDISDVFVSPALYGLIILQILSVMLLSRISVRRYWESWRKEANYQLYFARVLRARNSSIRRPLIGYLDPILNGGKAEAWTQCHHCHLSQPISPRCARCESRMYSRQPKSIQHTWLYLIAAMIAMVPANVLTISILISNGGRLEDTIISGIIYLVKEHLAVIAVLIFIASILVPAIKICGLAYLLLSIHFKGTRFHRQKMSLYFVIKWIGKWSMMDLFVISIMLTLVDRGQFVDFTPGYAAIAFAMVVVFTMLAAESLDTRLMWDNAPPPNEPSGTINE